MENDLYWNNLVQTMSKNSGFTATELQTMSVKDFFITLTNLNKEWRNGKNRNNGSQRRDKATANKT